MSPRSSASNLTEAWVVLPTYNEAPNLARMVEQIASVDAKLRIVVVDDASPDGTGAIADALRAKDPRVHVIHRTERGLGTAYLAGFKEAMAQGGQALLTMDCDFSHDPAVIPQLLKALESPDVVIGSRYVQGGRIEGWPVHRKLLSRVANRFVHALFDIGAKDCTSGYRLYRSSVVLGIEWENVRSTGYSFLVESLYWASRQEGARLVEVPITFRDRTQGSSKLGWREAVHGARNLIRIWLTVGRR